MVCKTKCGRTFKGTVEYCLQENKNPEILHANNIASTSKSGIIKELVALSSTNDAISKPVWHSSLSFSDLDHNITNEKMVEIGNAFMEKAGFSGNDNQWITIKHNDRQHTHIHIIGNRVGFNNPAVSDYYYKSNSVKWAKELETEFGLIKTQDIAKRKRQTKQSSKEVDHTKDRIKKDLENILKTSGLKSFSKLQELLKEKDIEITVHKHIKTEEPYGISFEANGEKYKGSELGKKFTFKALSKLLNRSEIISYDKKNITIRNNSLEI